MSETPNAEGLNDQEIPDEILNPGSEAPKEETPAAKSDDKHTETSDDIFGDNPFEEISIEEDAPEIEAPKADEFDKDLDTWAEKAGHEVPETDRERKLLQTIRNGQREFTKGKQAKNSVSELDKVIEEAKKEIPEVDDYIDPLERKVAELETSRNEERTSRLQSEFFTEKAVTETTGKLMGDIIKEAFDKAPTDKKQQVLDYWSHPDQLPQLLEIAEARELKTRGDTSTDEAVQAERRRIEKESKGSSPVRNAKTTATKQAVDPRDPDPLWDNLD